MLVRQMRSRQKTMARDHNTALPINQLPDELLIKIFRKALEGQKKYCNMLFRLYVCLRWAALIRDTPSLWTFIRASDPLHISSMILERSSKYPLEVWYDESHWKCQDGEMIPEAKARAWIDMVGEHVYRWRRAKLTVRDDSSRNYLLESLERLSAPILETPEIDNDLQGETDKSYSVEERNG
ncbi:hypothetical protein FRB94_006463 [Tulasnella sp. JGI-2019a]|nr:hypothetical protein FRB93_004102 [Tulasnella sp. JGI-2019a]KAG8999043.1 hypothetical protein FRB94_006463 [Tulasnella sp. JGI-2019a]